MDPTGPVGPLGIRILNPESNQTVILPGELPVRVEITGTGDLLDSVGVNVIHFQTLTSIGDTTIAFNPPEGDTTFILRIGLGAFPNGHQLNIQARARADARSAIAAEVPVIVLDCSTGGFEFCPEPSRRPNAEG